MSKDGADAPFLKLRCTEAVIGVIRVGHISEEDGIEIRGLMKFE